MMMKQFWRSVCALFRIRRMEREMDAELRFHLEMETEKSIRAGMSPEDARRAALRNFGGVERFKEECRDVSRFRLIETLWQDVRFGARSLGKKPGFTLVAVTILALGIGANTTIFSLVNAVLLRPLSGVKDPGQLVALVRTDENGRDLIVSSYPDYRDYRDRNTVFTGLLAHRTIPLSLSSGDFPERLWGAVVSGNYFSVLGIEAALGRGFLPEEDLAPSAHPVAVVSHGLWQRSFGSNPRIIGQTVSLNAHRFTIVGVAPADFKGTDLMEATDVWVPMMMQAQAMPGAADDELRLSRRNRHWLRLIGRLKPVVSFEQAQVEMGLVAAQLRQEHPVENKGKAIRLSPGLGLDPDDRAEAAGFLVVLMAVVGLVLLIACANAASLLMARAASRRKEVAIRLALGASRARIIRLFLAESLLLSLAGAAAALLLGVWSKDWLLSLFAQALSPSALNFDLDVRIAGFTLMLSLATSLLFGLAPALQASKADVVAELKDAALRRPHRRWRLNDLFVVTQIAVSMALLIAAGLCVRALQKAYAINPGFEARNVLTLAVDLKLHGYDESKGKRFYQQLVERVAALPGVQRASLAMMTPLTENFLTRAVAIDGQAPAPDGRLPSVGSNVVTPGYFGVLGIPLVAGRDFGAEDTAPAPGVAIVNEAMARQFWPDESPLGKRVRIGGSQSQPVEIVGVARNSKYRTLSEDAWPVIYLPLLQHYQPQMFLHARAVVEPLSLVAAAQREVAQLDPQATIFDIKTLAQRLDDSIWPQRTLTTLTAIFGLLALALAAAGLYGVLSYSVAQRTHEIGIRMALGAQRRDVLKLIVRQGMFLVSMGIGFGIVAAFGVARLMASLLFGVSATDPLTLAGAALVLTVVAWLACYLPARRATKVDPMIALRSE